MQIKGAYKGRNTVTYSRHKTGGDLLGKAVGLVCVDIVFSLAGKVWGSKVE